jgi:hypothetical protein
MNTFQKRIWLIKFHSIIEYCKSYLISLPFRLTPARIKLNLLGSAYRESRLLYLVIKLNVADLIADKNMHVDDLAKALNLNVDNVYLLLRALVSLGVFNEVTSRVFSNNKISLLLRESSTSGLNHTILTYHNKHNNNLWFKQLDLVFKTNNIVVLDNDLNNYLANETLVEVTDINLASNHTLSAFEGFNWSSFDLMFDLGNAAGQHITEILRLSESMNICIYDNPKAIKSAKMFWKGQEPSSSSAGNITNNRTVFRVSFEEGEILRSLPKASTNENLYCFINIFSGLSDDDCLTILSNAKQAIGQFSATVVVIDSVLSTIAPSPFDAINDMQLLLEKNTKQRTIMQWNKLINKSDFTISEIVKLRSSNKVLVLSGEDHTS